VTRYQGRPFALVGVNLDSDAALVEQLQQKGIVTWRSFCGGADTIAGAYGVRGIPMVVLIDHKGIVRAVFAGAPDPADLDGQLDGLIAEAEAGT
jgi:hypothetical protein